MRQLFVKDEFYPSAWARVGTHLALWVFMFLVLLVQYQWINRTVGINVATFELTVGNFLAVLITYYLSSALILSSLYQKRWIWIVVGLLLIYIVNYLCFYYFFTEVSKAHPVSPGVQRVADAYRKAGLLGGFTNSAVFIMNWSYSLNAVIPVIMKFMKDVFVTRNRTTQLERDNLSLELNFLRSQVNPHFFFNAVNNVYSLIVDKDEQAATILLKLSSLMRYVLYEAGASYVPLHQEISFLSDYVGLEKIRHEAWNTIQLRVDGEVQGLTITPLILITFVENAFKHGLNATIKESWVTIDIRIEGNTLYFQAQNSKPSGPARIRKNPLPEVGGIGLANTQRRLELLYPDKHQLHIHETPSVYTVDLMIILHGTQPDLPDHRRRTAGAGVD
jgi:two-component system LytT family sensor kinase